MSLMEKMKISNGYEGLGLFAVEIEVDRVFCDPCSNHPIKGTSYLEK